MRDLRTLVLAFDGVLADTVPLRARAWQEAAEALGFATRTAAITEAIAGRTLTEASDLLLGADDAAIADPTRLALVSLQAERRYSALLQRGVPFVPDRVQEMHRAASQARRVVVRADSIRRQVEPVLELAGLSPIIALLRCSDDPSGDGVPVEERAPPRHTGPQDAFERSWTVIDRRLRLWSIGPDERDVIEANTRCVSRARHWSSQVRGIGP